MISSLAKALVIAVVMVHGLASEQVAPEPVGEATR
jgi:hypothetical protein